MRTKHLFYLPLLLFIFSLYSCQKDNEVAVNPDNSEVTANLIKENSNCRVYKVIGGLNNPRGLKFGPDGYLYVAEGGTGGNLTTTGLCDSVIPPVGPYTGGFTARILRVSKHGSFSVVADKLPSSTAALGFTSGVADIAFVGNRLFAILAGAGCSHGIENFPNSILKINHDGTWNMLADLSAYQKSHPVAKPEQDDFEPDGTWYSMISVHGSLYAVEPNHGELVKVDMDGNIKRVLDFSSVYGHIVPTTVAYHGNFYVGNLNTFPVQKGSSNIYKVTKSGQSKIWATGFSSITGLVIDKHKRMFVLETSAADGGPIPNTGRIVQVWNSGQKKVVIDSLNFPTGLTLGRDGALYVSNNGFGGPPGSGEILRIKVRNNNGHYDKDDLNEMELQVEDESDL